MLKVALGGVLLVTATHSTALSLGGTQSSVIIGRPLDILVQGSIEANESASGLCLTADVSYGDVRLPASAITAAIHRLGADGKGSVRVRANVPVNEPIVTVAVKAGCPPSFTRSYTLLADFEPAPVAVARDDGVAVLPVSAPSAAPTAVAPASRAQKPLAVRERPVVDASARRPSGKPEAGERTPTPVRLHAPRPRPADVVRLNSKIRPAQTAVKKTEAAQQDAGKVTQPVPVKPDAAPSGPRLKLDPVEVSAAIGSAGGAKPVAEPAPTAAQTAVSPPGSAPADSTATVPVSAAGGLPAPTEAGDSAALQKELQGLRAEQERLRLSMESMSRQLTEAEAARVRNPLVYGLGGLALALAGGLWWALRRRSPSAAGSQVGGAAPWWTVPGEDQTPEPVNVTGQDGVSPDAAVAPVSANPAGTAMSGVQVSEASASVFMETPIAQLDVNGLVDLWQQVAFFESLGHHKEAMLALEAFVLQYPRSSEAPYLFWLQIADQTDDDKAFDRAQALYEQHFHRLVPPLPPTPVGLETDADFMRQLSALWPQAPAQDILVRSLSSQPGDPSCPLRVRTPESFDDLLLLCGVLEQGLHNAELPLAAAPTASAEPVFLDSRSVEQADDWMTLSQVKASTETEEPEVLAQPTSGPALTETGHMGTAAAEAQSPVETQSPVMGEGEVVDMLDFQLPELPTVPDALNTGKPSETAEERKNLPPLDFDLDNLK